jgi:hypothetical protein
MTDRQSLLDEIARGYTDVQEAMQGLSDDQLETVFYDQWSVKEIVAHMLGWEREMTEALRRIARGERPTPEGVDYSNADEWNAKFATAAQGRSASAVIADWGQVHSGFVEALAAVPDDRFGEGKSVNRIAVGTGSGHYEEHVPAIKAWRQREGI